jgi:hypothetical protein
MTHANPFIHHLPAGAIGLLTPVFMQGTKPINFITVHGVFTGGKTT